jgi:uncharacterized membrane protein
MDRMARRLRAVKVVHTVVWAFFVACIVGMPLAALAGRFGLALALGGLVAGEVAVLALNGWRCPLTAVAARYTEERRDNFDIYLPLWLARYNKQVFGALFAVGLVVALGCWFAAR